MSERQWHGVPLLADEAARLRRDAENERSRCCPHLDVFHNSNHRSDGSYWRRCSFLGCQCEGEDTYDEPHRVALRNATAAIEKQERRDIAQAWWLFGCVVGVIAGWLLP